MMRLIFLPDIWTLVLCIFLWLFIQVTAALFCLFLPDKYFNPNNMIFRSYSWEKSGYVYERLFRVRAWKHLLPDGAAVWKTRGFRKKHLSSFSHTNLERYLVESARGELTHWLAIIPFWAFGFFVPPTVILLMLLYALIINVPCIMVQRYNRPRISRMLKRNDGTKL